MSKKKNRKRLIDLMDRYRVDSQTVAKLLNLSPTTVRIYRSKSDSDITAKDLELLEYKLKSDYLIR